MVFSINLPGIERKYFSLTLAGAQRYAELAAEAFAEGPFSFIMTSIKSALITDDLIVTVDDGIKVVTIPTDLLYALEQPVFLEGE